MKKLLLTALLTFSLAFFAQAQKANKAISTPAAARDQLLAGKKVYSKFCVSCHQLDGGGVPNLNPPLIKTTYVLGDKSRLIKIILNGSNESLEIDGETYSNPMPQLDILKDQEVADVLTYIRNSFGNKATAITAPEVKAQRSKKK
jgi:mono/diheme cytochrome c family protein